MVKYRIPVIFLLAAIVWCFNAEAREILATYNDSKVENSEDSNTRINKNMDSINNEFKHSFNFNLFELLYRNFSMNYEYLLSGYHGLIAEGLFSHSFKDGSNFGEASIGYRLHFSRKQESSFLGVTAGLGFGSGKVGWHDNTIQQKLGTKFLALNYGKRWIFDSGLNITTRLGVGYGFHRVSTDDNEPIAQDVVNIMNESFKLLPVHLDIELSIGWTF